MVNITFTSKKHGSYTVMVDNSDYQRLQKLKSMKWCVSKKRNGLVYFQKRFSDGHIKELHRWIMQPPSDKYVDHINGNTLDNRRCNLRIVSNGTNIRNGRVRTNNTSGYPGVRYRNNKKIDGVWYAYIRVNYKVVSLGSFDTFNEAVETRKLAQLKYWSQ